MGKRRKKRCSQKASVEASVHPVPLREERKQNIHARSYPARNIRNQAIARISNKKSSNRSGYEWWQLGEYQVINGLLDKDEIQIICGEECLLEGALLDKPYPKCLIDLGWLHFERGSIIQAKKYFLDATRADDLYRDAWAFLGITEIATNHRDRAINAFQKAVGLLGENPHESDIHALKLLKSSTEIPAALKKHKSISKFSLDEIFNFDQEDQAKAIRFMIDKALEAELPSEQVKELLDHLCAIEYSGLSNLQRTIDICIKSIECLDTTHIPHLFMGLAYKKLGKKVLSLEAYRRCCEKDPFCELAVTNIADILLENGRPREAYTYLLQFRESGKDVESGNFYNNLGNAIAELGMPIRDELKCRENALKLDPKKAIFILNHILSLIVNGDLVKAKGLLFQYKKRIISSLGSERIVIHETLIEVMTKVSDPSELLLFYYKLLEILSTRDAAVFLVKAWEKREFFKEDNLSSDDKSNHVPYPDFINELGVQFGNAGLHQYSLKCWEELLSIPGYDNASWNIPVSLDSMGLHEEALEALKHTSGECIRKNTITANLLSSTDLPQALDYYLRALSEDDPLLMPIQNGFGLAKQLNKREYYGDFLNALRQISDSTEKTILYSRIKMQQGFYFESCSLLEGILVRKGDFLDVKQIRAEVIESSPDLTLLGERVGLDVYKQLAYLYILTAQYKQLSSLAETISRWDVDLDGDWLIIESIALSMQGRTQEAIEVVSGMSYQPPPILAKAFALVCSDDLDGAIASLSNLHQFENNFDGFNFPLCLPSAFQPSLESLHYLSNDNVEKAMELANFAIGLDPSSVWITDIYTNVLEQSCGLVLSADYLLRLHQNAPGNTKLLRKLIMSLAHEMRIKECRGLLKNIEEKYGRSYVEQSEDLWRMIDILSVQKLEDDSSSRLPEWSSLLDEQGKQHLKEITEIRETGFNSIIFSLMISRFSEYLLRRYFFLPLAAMVELSECVPWERAKNASAYLLDRTLREPSLGDMISLIKQMAYQRNRSNPYIRMLRQATLQISIDFDQLFSYDFIGSLCRLRDYRNCIMHADDPSIEDFEFVRSFIFTGNDLSPGEFVSTLIRVDQL